MVDSELLRAVKQEIARQVNIILSGTAQGNTLDTEDIGDLYPGMATMTGRPIMHPYGMVSRAPQGTISVVARQGEHPGNRLVLGHRDAAKPTVEEGEVKLYNAQGEIIYLKDGEISLTSTAIKLGSEDSDNPLVLGDDLQALLSDVLGQLKILSDHVSTLATDVSSHQHPTAAPGPPSPPATAALFVATAANLTSDGTAFDGFKSSPVDDGALLSEKVFTEKGGS